MFLDCRLRTDSRMIHARQPKNFKALHSRAARKNILDGVVEHVAEREHAGNVWRGHHDRERRLRRFRVRNEIAIFHPALIPFRFKQLWIVSLRNFCHCDQSSKARARLQINGASGGNAMPRACIPMFLPPRSRCMSDSRPIGVFNSGIGGLTVVKALRDLLPNEKIFYLGDTARVPYGGKSAETVQRYAVEVADMLIEENAKMVVVACNTASSVALRKLEEHLPVPVTGVIRPGARAAIAATQNDRIGVIGTRATIKSGAYERELRLLNPDIRISVRACPLLVPLI